jgi:hypothetical protein
MRWAPEWLAWCAVSVLGLVAALLPSLLGGGATSATVTAAVVLLALAALASLCTQVAGRAAHVATAIPGDSVGRARPLSARVTDAPHHPLRPRAPGRA